MADSTTGLGVPRERHRAWSLGGALSHTWTPSPRLHLLPVCTWDPRFLALEERLGFGFRHLPYLSRLRPVTCPPCWAFSSNQRSLPHAVPLLSWAQPGLSLRPPPPTPPPSGLEAAQVGHTSGPSTRRQDCRAQVSALSPHSESLGLGFSPFRRRLAPWGSRAHRGRCLLHYFAWPESCFVKSPAGE